MVDFPRSHWQGTIKWNSFNWLDYMNSVRDFYRTYQLPVPAYLKKALMGYDDNELEKLTKRIRTKLFTYDTASAKYVMERHVIPEDLFWTARFGKER